MIRIRSDLPQWFVKMGYKKGAEIGTYKGEFTTLLCEAGLYVYAIDPWKVYSEQLSQKRQDFLYGHAQRALNKFKNCTIIRKFSMDAVKDFKDESLDFVYIDGDHSFKAVACDIAEWAKKVRKGGAVSGHDYYHQASQFVRPIVNAYVEAHKIKLLYIFGSKKLIRERGDRHHSWLWIKE